MSTEAETKAKEGSKTETKVNPAPSTPSQSKAPAPENKKQEAKKEEANASPDKAEIKLPEKLAKILKAVEELTVLELAELVKGLEKKFGVSAAAPVAAVAVSGQPAGAAAEEKTSFQVVLASIGDKKIQVIKEIRAVTTLGLKEAKDLVESAPKPVKDGVGKEEAEKIKAALEKQGAKVEIK